jgi:hypothetical protein
MPRNLPKRPGDGSDGSPPSEAWLFAQAIQGKPIPKIVGPGTQSRGKREELERLAQFSTRHAEELRRLQAAEAKARHEREILEWAAGISTHAEEKLRALRCKEAEERGAWRRAESFVESLLEGSWDPSQHPRLGGPPNAGWWSTSGSAATTEPSSGRTIAATNASHTTSKGTPAHFAAAQSGGGHHWVPQKVYGDFKSNMADKAYDIFKAGTKSPEMYDHAFDTWNGVTHGEYIDAMRKLLDDWIKTRG